MRKIDKSHLPPDLIEKQIAKGTFDSPCMSVCNYAGPENECQTCGMRQLEKQEWKLANASRKEELLKLILSRPLHIQK